MKYTPLEIDRNNLTIMGVTFPNLKTLESVAFGIGTNMYEGYKPTKKGIEIARDYFLNKISDEQLLQIAKEKSYE